MKKTVSVPEGKISRCTGTNIVHFRTCTNGWLEDVFFFSIFGP